MKSPLLVFLGIFLSAAAFSQAYDGSITYNKKKQQAIVIDYGYPEQAVENALVQKIEKMGYRAREEKGLFNKDKGFIVFKNASLPDISSKTMDYIVKIERKSRKEKDETTLYLVINDDKDGTIAEMDAYDIGKAKTFLNNLLPEIEEANLELQIKDQEENIEKSEKKFKDLTEEKKDLEKKIADLQKDIENGKKSLELLKGKRRPAVNTL